MIVYKAFEKGLTCRGYQFQPGMNETGKANCAQNGFHAAENPIDCFTYYNISQSSTHTYYLCDAGGDIDEDGHDSKISCTRLELIRELSLEEMAAAALVYIMCNPTREFVLREGKLTCARDAAAMTQPGIAIVRGRSPKACGCEGAILGLAKESVDGTVEKIRLYIVDNILTMENAWYGMEGRIV